MHNTDYGYDSPGKNWLALNPVVAHKMGWNLVEDGLFKWVDDEGQMMVESVWWADGFVGQSPPHHHNEVGEGWLVLASQAAWNAIRSEFGILKQVIDVERSSYQDDQLSTNNISWESMIE